MPPPSLTPQHNKSGGSSPLSGCSVGCIKLLWAHGDPPFWGSNSCRDNGRGLLDPPAPLDGGKPFPHAPLRIRGTPVEMVGSKGDPMPPQVKDTHMQLRGVKGETPMQLEGVSPMPPGQGGPYAEWWTYAPQNQGDPCSVWGPARENSHPPRPPQDKGNHIKLGGVQRRPHDPPQ